jgi:acetolactate synthase small subunit
MAVFYRPRNLKLKSLKEQENQQLIKLSEYISERLYNIRLVKICHTEALEKLKLNKALLKYYEYVQGS